ncbi:MAG: condensation domain-containing protein, partial [Psychrosphaera sp.]|nr:condensation domain-containing protein [Psychrosphaera sp.]
DSQLNPVPMGVSGEMFVGGGGVARGYLNQSELTASRFIDNPHQPGERLYRTGDLACFLKGGEIDYLGRIDEQVKIRGFRIELGEIEQQILALNEVESTAVLAFDDQLVAYVVGDAANLRTQLETVLPAHMIPSYFIELDVLPLTANGKVDRKALPAPQGAVVKGAVKGEYITPATPTEIKLSQIWAELLKLDAQTISNTANFFESGGHSLLSVRLIGEVRSQMDVELAISDVFDHATLTTLAAKIDSSSAQTLRSEVVAIDRSVLSSGDPQSIQLPASFAQQRLWFIDQMDGGSSQYNMSSAMQFEGDFDAGIVEQAFNRIVQRHEPLRTVFVEFESGTQQLIKQNVMFELTTMDLTGLDAQSQASKVQFAVKADAEKTFDLTHDLMLRSTFIRMSANTGVLLFNMHHIASDGWSMGLLVEEFARQYVAISSGEPDPYAPLAVQYADYALWQRDYLAGEVLQTQLDYWDT